MEPVDRFGIEYDVETFEEINRLSLEVLIKTKDVVHAHGFELLYTDIDYYYYIQILYF